MEANHTPGPWALAEGSWEIEARVDPENSETYYAPVAMLDTDWSGGIVEANARLIAAAPDMLDALSDIVASSDANCGDSLANAIETARAAIAKATGEVA